ncbi:IQ motif [Macleaya cordata]|uniref:IQ motif n=1 Tax=Macleaya cordata TaxID=56857 RepID=A0A200QCY1_MACCD|nr:IQ motif [Macleaya cordata]
MNLSKGFKVWIEDRVSAWEAGEILDVAGKQVQVVTASGKKVSAPREKLCPRDPDEDHAGVDDLTKLTYLNEPEVLYNLARRHALNDIYTYTGSILVAVNPFTKLPHLYNVHMMEQYKGAPLGELSPHVFAIADASYRSMMSEGQSQSILVSGESGAGKTETTKLLMQYLTYVGGRAAGDHTVEQQILESNPLLEAFGNARTVRNDNSSRFGKFVEIHFDVNGRISGAAIRSYLLERSRVVQITDPERSFHCFYQLCASGKVAERYKLDHPSNFHYLNQSKTYELDGVSNAKEYMRTRRAMDIVGISLDDQEAIFRTLAAILHLGNIEFSPGKENDSSTIKDQKSSFHLQMAADLFMCDANLLLATLCTRSIQTREGSIVKALDCYAAKTGRDALAKTVYARLFDWLVEKINRSLGQDMDSEIQIGVLDIYGFECFKKNSFEQFCINFANEKLQQHFNEHVFKMEQEEYSKEKINWSYIEFIDNQDVLDLIERKPIGIIALLDEACMFPKSTHETFSTKLFQSSRDHPRLGKTKFSQTDFTVTHYAGKACNVTYQTDTFLDKNRDYVVVEHCTLLSSSKCSLLAGLFPSLPEVSSRSSYKFSSVASRFKQQLQALMESLKSTEPHYIRCVKPNSLSRPHNFENQSILQQLRCGGVLEAVRISLAGYPTRRTYSEFLHRFGILAPEIMDGSYDEKTLTKRILQKLKLENFQLGRSKVFLRAGQIALLDSRRTEVLDTAAKLIQCRLRTFLAHKDFISTRAAAVVLQAYSRGLFLSRNMFAAKQAGAAARSIQKFVRRWVARRAYLQLCWAVLLIQSSIRGLSSRQIFLHRKEHRAALRIQTQWRMFKAHSAFQHYQSSMIAIQCMWRQNLAKRELRRLKLKANEAGTLRLAKNKLEKQLEDLTWRVELEKRLRISSEEAKLIEVSKLQKALDSSSLELDAAKSATLSECNKNLLLLSQLEASMKENSALECRIIEMEELRKENSCLKSSSESLAKENSAVKLDLIKAQKDSNDTLEKLREVEEKYLHLQQNFQSLEEKLSNLEEENHVLRQKALCTSPKINRPGYTKPFTEVIHEIKPVFKCSFCYEPNSPTKLISPFTRSLSETFRSKMTSERHQDNHEFLLRCIKEDLGFKDGKPVAACIIYTCLLHWHAFESERTAIFDRIIEGIKAALKVGNVNNMLPYWLSNASTLLCLLQRNLRSNGFFRMPFRRSAGHSGVTTRMMPGLSPLKCITYEESISHVEATYPAILFKQQLTAYVEKIFGLIRDNLKKEIAPLLSLCIQAPKNVSRRHVKYSKSPEGVPQQSLSSHWDRIIKFLDSLMSHLRENYVPSFFIRKLITQVFSFINISLFNSLLLRRECCTFSNGEYVKSGLAELERWITNATEEFAGTSWHELNYIRQAVGFLVIHQKRKKSLEQITQEVCPALTVRQIYRICTMYCDDKYSTQSVSTEVVEQMREILNKAASQNLNSNSFLLDDDLSIPFSTEDISEAIPEIEPSDVEFPPFVHEYACAQFLLPHQE